MSKHSKYYVTGWSRRFGDWIAESIDTTSAKQAKEHLKTKYPSLIKLKAYALRTEN